MRYIYILKSDHQGPPSPGFFEAAHELAQREIAAGRMIGDGALAPPALAAEVRLKGKVVTTHDGPFAETKEAIVGFAIFELPDRASAEASAVNFLNLHREHIPGWEGSVEIREVMGSQTAPLR